MRSVFGHYQMGDLVGVDPTINSGTAGVINLLNHLHGKSDWETAIAEEGVFLTYGKFFGYPFDYTYQPLVPDNRPNPYCSCHLK